MTAADEKPTVDHASGPECYRAAVRLLHEAADMRKELAEAVELNPLADAHTVEQVLVEIDRRVAGAAVWAALAQAAATAEVGGLTETYLWSDATTTGEAP